MSFLSSLVYKCSILYYNFNEKKKTFSLIPTFMSQAPWGLKHCNEMQDTDIIKPIFGSQNKVTIKKVKSLSGKFDKLKGLLWR